ncbi:Hypothetical predicted protein [Cloeon dipterum]|uniref:Ig-like domain-containing protein n=2 Tax=Cloeon dipterum TaxID=197152 RepID=A0A8S1D8Y3_9INSE|nr:Hypothetical predicted protein [Cloeon dipterum]
MALGRKLDLVGRLSLYDDRCPKILADHLLPQPCRKFDSEMIWRPLIATSVAAIFLAVGVVADGSSIVGNRPPEGMFKLILGKPLRMECNVTDENPQITWVRLNLVSGEEEDVDDKKEKYDVVSNKQASSLTIRKVTLDDVKYDYTCKLSKVSDLGQTIGVSETFITYMAPTARLPKDVSLEEGTLLTLNCSVTGKPKPTIQWKVGNTTLESDGERISINYNILQIQNATKEDRAEYTCIASIMNGAEEASATANVRVKDKLSPLWPFIGICLEVVVLCLIILIYEKRRNKSELEESDTDQSPEQKNTPDVGKDVRHRNK